ncbi:Helix-turn-helix domain protein [compost metagenome]
MGASLSVERMPFRETLNQRLSLVDAIPRTGSAGTAITEASAFSQRINVFEQQLLPLILDGIQVPEMINQCLYYMIRTGGHSSIENLAGQIGYTSRYIRKKFDDYMGISPKLYSRIIRFQQVLHHLVVLRSWDYDQSGINGYYDQSHFLKEFKQFTMLTPAQFLHAVRTNPTYNNA